MKEFIRIVQTDVVEDPEIHESEIDVTGLALDSLEVTNIKNFLNGEMVSGNKKYQKHICDHDEPIRTGCILEDIQ